MHRMNCAFNATKIKCVCVGNIAIQTFSLSNANDIKTNLPSFPILPQEVHIVRSNETNTSSGPYDLKGVFWVKIHTRVVVPDVSNDYERYPFHWGALYLSHRA